MKKTILLSSLILIISLFLNFFKIENSISLENNLLTIHIIDVGQGDCILIQAPNDRNILIDGGDEDSFHIIDSYLNDLNINKIHAIFISHFDSDHIGSLDNIIDSYEVTSIFSPRDSKSSESVYNLKSSIIKSNNHLDYVSKGDIVNLGNNLAFHILSPSYISDDSNSNSLIIKFNYKNKSFLFTGDSDIQNEADIINSYDLEDIDFLKVGHHGSSTSTSEAFLDEITPDIAAISCGYKNSYGHPHDVTLNNLLDRNVFIYRTDLMGDLVFYCDGETIFTDKNYLKE